MIVKNTAKVRQIFDKTIVLLIFFVLFVQNQAKRNILFVICVFLLEFIE